MKVLNRNMKLFSIELHSIWRVVTSLVALGFGSAHAADVSFRTAFDAAMGQDVVTITVPDSDVLVFDGGAYFSQGKRIVIAAAKARVDADTRIGFYNLENSPDPKSGVAATGPTGARGEDYNCSRSGCPGKQGLTGLEGAPGDGGANGTSIVLDVGVLAGNSRLTVAAAGQTGGKAQKGGKGGTGGKGGDGAERSCGGALGLDTRAGPGDGGVGGPGGVGGVGGVGGRSGDGGLISLSTSLVQAVDSGVLVIDLGPLRGGAGGDAGDAGDPGEGGGMGGGKSCGGGGSSGPRGGPGSSGSGGVAGASGRPGILRYWIGDAMIDGSVTHVENVSFGMPATIGSCPPLSDVSAIVTVPSGMVVVELTSVRLLAVSGVSSTQLWPTLRPVSSRPDQVKVVASFSPARMPRLSVYGFPPQFTMYFDCLPVVAQAEVTLKIAPQELAKINAAAAPSVN